MNGLGGFGGVAVAGLRIVAIGLEQHLLLREIRDEHPVVVTEILQVVQLDDVRAVGQHLLLADRLDHRLLPGLLRLVRIQRVRRAQDFLEIRLVHLMGEDGRAFGDERRAGRSNDRYGCAC